METYERETEEIIARLLQNRLSLPECRAGLNAAFASVLARLDGKQLDSLRLRLMSIGDLLAREKECREEFTKSAS